MLIKRVLFYNHWKEIESNFTWKTKREKKNSEKNSKSPLIRISGNGSLAIYIYLKEWISSLNKNHLRNSEKSSPNLKRLKWSFCELFIWRLFLKKGSGFLRVWNSYCGYLPNKVQNLHVLFHFLLSSYYNVQS